ncbi:MAG: hypothetical protein ABIF85_02620 [Nanoarchaeota archaeon]
MNMQQPQREIGQDTLMILEPALVEEFFARRISAFLKKLIDAFQKTHGRAIPMHRAYALASPTFTREECYDVLKALREKKILNFSVPHGITITDTSVSQDIAREKVPYRWLQQAESNQ